MSTLGKLMPSPRALLVFEAAARHGSCGAAAREFNLTQPSVSRNIAQLEAEIGVRLFMRSPQGMTLTEEGQALHRAVTEGFGLVGEAMRELASRHSRKDVVELSLSTAFVTHWFIPRMQAFYRDFPTVDLRFQLLSGSLRGAVGDVDLAMRRRPESDADFHVWHFAPEVVLPVASPAYVAAHGRLDTRPDADHTLLHLDDPLIDWDRFWHSEGRPGCARRTWVRFSDYAVVLQAAMNGEGIAQGWLSVVSRPLRTGALVPAATRRVGTGDAYCLLAPRGRKLRGVVEDIRTWLCVEMERDLAAIGDIAATPTA
jgi:LysR family transcriptional regulator, glycine cleavage system transcriptional activator